MRKAYWLLLTLAACAVATEDPLGAPSEDVSASTGASLRERDVALVFDIRKTDLVRATDPRSTGGQRLPATWYAAALQAIATIDYDTRDAINEENLRSDFRVVSARVTPCAPLTDVVADAAALCWPEVRLVWQPIVSRPIPNPVTFENVNVTAFADDRAIHTLFDAAPEVLLTAADASQARTLRDAATAAARAGQGRVFLASPDGVRFAALRDRAARQLRGALLALRTPTRPDTDYEGLAVRPESGKRSEWIAFGTRFRGFLDQFATADALKQLTAFSFGRGRSPTNLFGPPHWVFVSLRRGAGGLVAEPITIRSPETGAVIANLGAGLFASAAGVNAQLDAAIATAPPQSKAVLLANTVVGSVQTSQGALAARARVGDASTLLVANTDCASCHQLDTSRPNPTADLHNLSTFSYFDPTTAGAAAGRIFTDGFQISPRVRTDVAFDLGWFATR